MKNEIKEFAEIPEGIMCIYENKNLICKKDGVEIKRKINLYGVEIKIEDSRINFFCKKGNKNDLKKIRSLLAHMRNMFQGLNERFVYKLQSANVHFPMTIKLDKNKVIISNFLGEKVAREAIVPENVDIQIKGAEIIISSYNKESAGQAAANLEKATRIKYRDSRVFQDGVYIVDKPERITYKKPKKTGEAK